VDREVNNNFRFNKETEFVPILGQVATQLNSPANPEKKIDDEGRRLPASNIQCNHHPAFLSLLSNEVSISTEQIHDFDMYVTSIHASAAWPDPPLSSLYDTQPSVLGGLNNEFIFSPRLDNLFSS
jgi:aspartyl aminopeptidase